MKNKEIEKDQNGLYILDGCFLTEYTKIRNCYISSEYSCNDLGVTSTQKKDVLDICSPISLVSIRYDAYKEITYYEFEYYNKNTSKINRIIFSGSEIGKAEMIKQMRNKGLSIVNDNSFNKFINMMIRSNEKVIDYNKIEGNETNFLRSQVGATSYGWVYTENGFEYDRFIKKDDIIYKDPNIDGPLFQQKGTLEEQIKVIEDVAKDFKNPNILKAALAFSYSGIILPACGIDNPAFLLTGPSGCGKQILSDLSVGQFGKNHTTGKGLQRASGDSEASRNCYRTKLGNLTVWVDELQDEINKNKKRNITPAETIKEKAYEITVGTNGSRANENGTIRENMNISHCPIVFCCEGNQFAGLNDGGSSRILMIDSGLSDGESFLKSNDTEQYRHRILNNYGHTCHIFISYIQELMLVDDADIADRFKEYKKIAMKKTEQAKIANNMAVLALTYNLMVESGCVPASWNKWELEEIFNWLSSMNEFKSSTKLVMDAWIDSVLSNGCIPYVSLSKGWKQSDYDNFSRNQNTKIRGKKEIKEGVLYVYIPSASLKEQLEYEAQRQGITGFCYDLNRLGAAGYLKESKDPKHKYRWKKKNITREYNTELNQKDEDVCVVCVNLYEEEIEEHNRQMEKDKEIYNKAIDNKVNELFNNVLNEGFSVITA